MNVVATATPVSHRVLVVADWRTDPYGVMAACRRPRSVGETVFAFVVPAWLHGLDWAGDPNASRPCARRHLETLTRLAASAHLNVDLARVGDPDPTSAVDDALQDFAATDIVLCRECRRPSHPLDLAHRLRRTTGLPVAAPRLYRTSAPGDRRYWRALAGGGHCVASAPRLRRSH